MCSNPALPAKGAGLSHPAQDGAAAYEGFAGHCLEYSNKALLRKIEETGVVPESEKTVAWTYTFYDAYHGIRLQNSRVTAGVDCEGVRYLADDRRAVAMQPRRCADDAYFQGRGR